ncbi:MAG TPA: glycosyltransferase family 39 protein, partial [Terriglobales bacterium]|nr:glycosyltransferase family 39 protein [Terriglobales bacterium]
MSQSVPAVSLSSPGQSSTVRARARVYVLLIVVVWAAIYVSSLFQPALLDDADSVHAEAAREMVLRHDWVTLHINGIRYLEKAPLLYWGMAASFKTFGVSEWSARLPLALGVLALLLSAYRLGRRLYGPEGGFYSALALGA